MDKVLVTTDSVMKTFMSLEARDRFFFHFVASDSFSFFLFSAALVSESNAPKLNTDFEACVTSQRAGMETRGVLIEDLNGLFGFEDVRFHSLFFLLESNAPKRNKTQQPKNTCASNRMTKFARCTRSWRVSEVLVRQSTLPPTSPEIS